MTDKSRASLTEIEQHWSKSAKAPVDQDGLRPVARDPYLQDVVETAMERWLPANGTLFDIGSGDGYSTIRLSRSVAKTYGFDFIPDFVEAARQNAAREKADVSFNVGSVMDLAPVREQFGQADVVTTIRCLINLGTWDNQRRALDEIASVVKPGGLYLMSEGWAHGWEGLSKVRQELGLGSLYLVPHNLLLERKAFEEHVSANFEIIADGTLGLYLLLSRVLQPLYTAPEAPQHKHLINRVSALMTNHGIGDGLFREYDYAGVCVMRRK
jgi:SAM-dependent methyltransferase